MSSWSRVYRMPEMQERISNLSASNNHFHIENINFDSSLHFGLKKISGVDFEQLSD